MKQLLQNNKTGKMEVAEVPPPQCGSGGVLVANRYSLISAGTERQKVETARKGYIGKARARPDLLRKFMNSVRTEGFATAWRKAQARLDQASPLGYSTAGVVVEVGSNIADFAVGDRVACAGAEYAHHAELVYVPHNLCVPVPETIDLSEAAYTTVGAIALHGVRQAAPQLGENVMVIGLGLLGVITVQLLKAAGCKVIGVDVAPERVEAAKRFGCDVALLRDEDVEGTAAAHTRGAGVDAVIITAGGEKNNDPVELAGDVTRDRGRVVVVGMVKTDLPRRIYYDKELSLFTSRSYGPGRYDPLYEAMGIDYPIGYVRWTERENMLEFVRLVSSGAVDVKGITTHTFDFDDALSAYELLMGPDAPSTLGVLLKYAGREQFRSKVEARRDVARRPGAVRVGVIGVGNFCVGTLLPHLKGAPGVELVGVASARGVSAKSAADRFGFAYAGSTQDLLADENINAVLIATRHNTHARLVSDALRAGKAIFVEKPLALDKEQLAEVVRTHREVGGFVLVGHNRRFSPMVTEIDRFFANRKGPLMMNYRVNAGPLEENHWMRATAEGGSRVISEGCHFLDALMFLAGARPIRAVGALPQGGYEPDTAHALVTFADGSIGTLTYVTNCDPKLPKERLEVFGDGKGALLDDFRALRLHSGGAVKEVKKAGQDKGHKAELELFARLVAAGEPMPVPLEHLAALSLATFAIISSAADGLSVDLDLAPLFAEPAEAQPNPG
jgi:predicted dehydrogenase/threonine dehydrogenase-like Zn-dependent dehydrogenase